MISANAGGKNRSKVSVQDYRRLKEDNIGYSYNRYIKICLSCNRTFEGFKYDKVCEDCANDVQSRYLY